MGEPGGGRDISSLVQFDLGADSVVRPPFSGARVKSWVYFVVFNTIGKLLLIMVWRAYTMRARRPRCVTCDHSGSSHFDRKIAQ